MKWIGLTGGIATGKSTVAKILRTKGLPVVDADELAHLALRPGSEVYQKIIHFFSPAIVSADGTIDRKKLGTVVFADFNKLKFLEDAIHPWVQEQVKNKRLALEGLGYKLAFYDVPLLFEKKLAPQFDVVVVVACDAQTQLQRLQTRNHWGQEEAQKRIQAQMPLAEKIAQANYVIENNGSEEELKHKVDQLIVDLQTQIK